MINHSTSIVNNKCRVTFDLSPKSITCSRSNYTATHVGGGTTVRKGIWEGIELVEARIKVGNKPWVSYDTTETISIDIDENDVTVQAEGLYSLKTMGYHFQCTDGSIPFFYYGNYGNNLSRYSYGNFTDSTPVKPKNNLYGMYAIVPKDWDYHTCAWSDWAYKHGQDTNNWAHDNGRFEQLNGSANNSNGWISDAGYKQISRKSCSFYFRKYYYDSVVTSGIVKDAINPQLNIHPAKGSSGKLTLKYVDNNNASGEIWLRAYCNGIQKEIRTYDTSGTFYAGQSWDYDIDFDAYFGREHEGHDVYYQAWAKNAYGKESPGTGLVGGHRYNGRPTTPQNLSVSGKRNIIYNDLTFTWDASSDPDEDSVSYEVWIKTIDADGYKIRDKIVESKIKDISYNFDIGSDPDGCDYEVWVRATDGLLYSDWSYKIDFKKGSKPKGTPKLVSPSVPNTGIYSVSPRFIFSGYDGTSTFIVNLNGIDYDNKKYSECFSINGDKVMFVAPDDNNLTSKDTIAIKAYMRNVYGESPISETYNFKRREALDKIRALEITEGYLIKELQDYINDKAKAYNRFFNFTRIVPRETFITCDIYNELVDSLRIINNGINSILNNDAFNRKLNSKMLTPNTKNEEKYWDAIIADINII